MSSPPSRGCAYFDVDGTLVATSEIRLYFAWMRRLGLVRRRHLPRIAAWSVGYRLGLLPATAAYAWLGRRLAGRSAAQLYADGEAWFEEVLRPRLYPGALRCLAEQRAAGVPVALLTGGADFVAAPLARALGVADRDLLCTRYEQRDGLMTGRCFEPICYGPWKVEHARRHAAAGGYDLALSSFYTDSVSDRPMLEAVGQPRPVNPDPRLARLAARRGWPVLYFRL